MAMLSLPVAFLCASSMPWKSLLPLLDSAKSFPKAAERGPLTKRAPCKRTCRPMAVADSTARWVRVTGCSPADMYHTTTDVRPAKLRRNTATGPTACY